jgi:hypothetical protein
MKWHANAREVPVGGLSLTAAQLARPASGAQRRWPSAEVVASLTIDPLAPVHAVR